MKTLRALLLASTLVPASISVLAPVLVACAQVGTPPVPAPPVPTSTQSAPTSPQSAATLPQTARSESVRTITIDGVERTALVCLPASVPSPTPIVFVFHGHGGNSRQIRRATAVDEAWPEAIVIYPQGLPAVTRLDPRGARPGWQVREGTNDDRDLKLVDALIAALRVEGWLDESRVYATGHSNGAGFTCLLAAERPGVFAAIAPVHGGSAVVARPGVQPIPWMHVAARGDAIVKFAGQELVREAVLRLNGCSGEGVPWGDGTGAVTDASNGNGAGAVPTRWESPNGSPVVAYIHDGGHNYPREATPFIVRFFKEQCLRRSATPGAEPK